MIRKIEIRNKSSVEIMEVRFVRKVNGAKKVGKPEPIYPGETMTVELPSYEAMQLRKRVRRGGRYVWTSWSTAAPASSTKKLPAKKRKAAESRGVKAKLKGKKKRTTKTIGGKKKAAKKRAKKKARPKKKPAGKKKTAKTGKRRKRPKCSICGKRVDNTFRHRWNAHRSAVISSLKKAVRKAKGAQKKRLKATLATARRTRKAS